MRLLKAILKQQMGYALPMALILLLLGGFLVVPTLALMSTSLNANRLVDRATLGLYAADSGVEDALYKLKYTSGPPPSYPLTEMNQMQVTVQTESLGTYTLYAGEFVVLSPCSQRLQIDTQIGDAPIEDDIYEYTIIVDVKAPEPAHLCGGNINLEELGTILPVGYEYVAGSAALYPDPDDQLSTDNPQLKWDAGKGDWELRWLWEGSGKQITLEPPKQNQPVTRYQKFHITGTGNREGAYSWVKARRANIDVVGEITGTVYIITATAKKDGQTTAVVTAEVLRQGSSIPYGINVIFWEATK